VGDDVRDRQTERWHQYLWQLVVRRRVDLLAVILLALFSSFAAAYALGARPGNLDQLWAAGDLLPVYADAKGMIENGWFSPNPQLGYPFVQDFSGFPQTEYVQFGIIKILTVITGNALTSVNLYVVLTFPLVAIAGFALFRSVRIPILLAAFLAFGIAFVPWHFVRIGHILLANYSSMLVGLLLVGFVLRGTLDGPINSKRKVLLYVLMLFGAVYVGLNGVYYAAFTVMIGGLALLFQVIAGRRVIPSIRSFLFLMVVPLTLVVALVAVKLGEVYDVTRPVIRSPFDGELYGGQFMSLLSIAPSIGSGILPPQVARLSEITPEVNAEGLALNSLLTFVGVVVALTVLGLTLAGSRRYRRFDGVVGDSRIWTLALAVALLLFVKTGLGTMISFAISPQIRAWGRISIAILAIALVVLGIVVTRWWRSRKWLPLLAALGILIALPTILDPFWSQRQLNHKYGAKTGDSLTAYIGSAEQVLAPNCPVLELPITVFPEVPPVFRSRDYSALMPYLYSSDLRWSYGALKTSDAGHWVADNLANKGVAAQAAAAEQVGFCAVQLDLWGFDPKTVDATQAAYKAELGEPIAKSTDGRWVMYQLNPVANPTLPPAPD